MNAQKHLKIRCWHKEIQTSVHSFHFASLTQRMKCFKRIPDLRPHSGVDNVGANYWLVVGAQ